MTPRGAITARKALGRRHGGRARRSTRTGSDRGERGHELRLGGVELEVVGDERLGAVEPARGGEALARRGDERHRVGGAAVERGCERARETRDGAQANAVIDGVRPLGERIDRRRVDEGAAQRHERAREGGGDRARRRTLGQAQAGAARLGEEPRGEESVVSAVPRPQAAAEEDGLGERARELEGLPRVDAGHRAAGRGEPPRQLGRRGAGRDEKEERTEAHRSGHVTTRPRRPGTAAGPAPRRRAIMRHMDPIVRLEAYFDWLVSRPIAELSRWQRRLRFLVDLARHSHQQMNANDSGEMAAALTYRTIFGLVPLLMVSMLAFRLFGDMEHAAGQLQRAAYAFFNYQVDVSRPEAAAFKEVLDQRILDVVKTVSGLSFETIGAIGALLLIWAALNLLVSFENAANKVYRAPRGRSWLTRVGIYWTVLTLGPILLLVVLYAAEFWLDRADALPVVGPFFEFLSHFGSLAGSFLALVLLYKLMPNTHVRWRPSLVGALIAAVLWSSSKWAFGLYVSRALPYLKLYGAIGLIPLFLFWLYLNWLIVLFGLEIAFTLQTMRGRVIESPEPDGTLKLVRPAVARAADGGDRARLAQGRARRAGRSWPRTSACAWSRWPSSSASSRRTGSCSTRRVPAPRTWA